jgi:hypothetical protein
MTVVALEITTPHFEPVNNGLKFDVCRPQHAINSWHQPSAACRLLTSSESNNVSWLHLPQPNFNASKQSSALHRTAPPMRATPPTMLDRRAAAAADHFLAARR